LEELLAHDEVDAVVVLAPMTLHGSVTVAALEAGKHVLVEKPLATTLDEGRAVLEQARRSDGLLACAPNVVLSGTYQRIREVVRSGEIGKIHLARGRYGHSGPTWGPWYYRRGGGVLFDLAVYNLTSLTGILGPVRRVLALTGTAIPERDVDGERVEVETVDNAQILLDFGESTFASVACGFTMRAYRSPALELYGGEGVVQMLGDDWAPEGFELYRAESREWERLPAPDPDWRWTGGLAHLVDCILGGRRPLMTVEHAFHVLEVMLGIEEAGRSGRAVTVESTFAQPEPG
jgi:predicted dehydrogenase